MHSLSIFDLPKKKRHIITDVAWFVQCRPCFFVDKTFGFAVQTPGANSRRYTVSNREIDQTSHLQQTVLFFNLCFFLLISKTSSSITPSYFKSAINILNRKLVLHLPSTLPPDPMSEMASDILDMGFKTLPARPRPTPRTKPRRCHAAMLRRVGWKFVGPFFCPKKRYSVPKYVSNDFTVKIFNFWMQKRIPYSSYNDVFFFFFLGVFLTHFFQNF